MKSKALEHAALAAALVVAFVMIVAVLMEWPLGFLGVGF